MKTNYWIILGTMVTTSIVAQVNTNRLPEIPPPASAPASPVLASPASPVATEAPAKKPASKPRVVAKISEPAVALVPGPATVVPPNLNLRGQAGLKGEVVARVKAGDTLSVISQINLDKHSADEPAQWAKVLLPTGSKVWIHAQYVDGSTKTVKAKKLNLRSGPGENYSVVGVIEKGESVQALAVKGEWIQIEAPASASAYVAAMFLKQEAPKPEPPVAPPIKIEDSKPVVVVQPQTETPVIRTGEPVQPPLVMTRVTPPSSTKPTPAVPAVKPAEPVTEVDTNLPPPPPRIVSHEGYVRSSVSPVAPTYYELYDRETGVAINYLFSPTPQLDLSRYVGFKIVVTGEEGMAQRWAATPVLTIQRIFVLESAANPESPQSQKTRATTPRQRR